MKNSCYELTEIVTYPDKKTTRLWIADFSYEEDAKAHLSYVKTKTVEITQDGGIVSFEINFHIN